MGAKVVELPGGRVLYDRDADVPLIPASNMKLVVISGAIDQLKADYQFRTVLAIRGEDLVVVGCGDPTLGDQKLAAEKGEAITAVFHGWAAKLIASGVRQIPGDLVIDDLVFDQSFVHPNWPADQYQAWYEAPVGGLNFNANCTDVAVQPGPRGKPAAASLVPGNRYLKISNRTTSGAKHGAWVHRPRQSDTLTVKGTVARQDRLGPVTVRDPGLYFGSVLKTVLAAKGIAVRGEVRREKLALDDKGIPRGAHVVAIHASPLTGALRRAGRDSLGMMAEALMKLLGAKAGGVGSWESGRAAVRSFFVKVGVQANQFVIDDGSGLSRQNRLSAAAATQVLAYMFSAPNGSFATLRESLARPGREGTLKRRLRGEATRDRVFAKTGYINGVRTLAGYVQGGSGRWLAFAFFYNGAGQTRPLARIQDEASEALVNWADEQSPSARTANAATE